MAGDFSLNEFDLSDISDVIPQQQKPHQQEFRISDESSVIYKPRTSRFAFNDLDDSRLSNIDGYNNKDFSKYSVEIGRSRKFPGNRHQDNSSSDNYSPVLKVTSKHGSPNFSHKENIPPFQKKNAPPTKKTEFIIPTEYRDDDSFYGKKKHQSMKKNPQKNGGDKLRENVKSTSESDLPPLPDISGLSSLLSSDEETSLTKSKRDRRKKAQSVSSSHKPIVSVPIDPDDQAIFSAFSGFQAKIDGLEKDKSRLAKKIAEVTVGYNKELERYGELEAKTKKYKAMVALLKEKLQSADDCESSISADTNGNLQKDEIAKQREDALEEVKKKDMRINELEQEVEKLKSELVGARAVADQIALGKGVTPEKTSNCQDDKGVQVDPELSSQQKENQKNQRNNATVSSTSIEDVDLSEVANSILALFIQKYRIEQIKEEDSKENIKGDIESLLLLFLKLVVHFMGKYKTPKSIPDTKTTETFPSDSSNVEFTNIETALKNIITLLSSNSENMEQRRLGKEHAFKENNDSPVDCSMTDPCVPRDEKENKKLNEKIFTTSKDKGYQLNGQRILKPIFERLDSYYKQNSDEWDQGNDTSETIRPSMPAKDAVKLLLDSLKEELSVLRQKLNQESELYNNIDPSISKHKRMKQADDIRDFIQWIETKCDQIYAVHDLTVDYDIPITDKTVHKVSASQEYRPAESLRGRWDQLS